MLPSDPDAALVARRLRMRGFGRTESELDFWEPRGLRLEPEPQQAPLWRRITRALRTWATRLRPSR